MTCLASSDGSRRKASPFQLFYILKTLWIAGGKSPQAAARVTKKEPTALAGCVSAAAQIADFTVDFWSLTSRPITLCVPKIRFCNIGDEGRRGQAVM
jgi:hypothetical protein